MKGGRGRDAQLIPSVYQQCVTDCSPPDLIVLRWNLSLVEANTLSAEFLRQWGGVEGLSHCRNNSDCAYRYGDKTPKSLMARLFSVIWIMIGITLCSMLTATLSSAFTNVTVDYYGVLSERKVQMNESIV